MALDQTKLIIDSSRFANGRSGKVITDRLGVDDGVDADAGSVVREVDGKIIPATPREEAAYGARVATQERTADIGVKAAALATPTVRALADYLAAKFPEDFA